MTDPLSQPFRRNLAVNPVVIPVGLQGTVTAVPDMTDQGVTSFKMANPTPFWVHYRGWKGTAGDMPTIKDMGHVIAPGAVDICRTQMPQWIAAVAVAEPGVPVTDTTGARLIMIYGSGS